MPKKTLFIFIIILLLSTGCSNEKKDKYFKGIVSEDTDTFFIVIPNEDDPIKEMGNKVWVPKKVVSADGIPDISVDDKIQVIYKDAEKVDDGIKLDIVYAIYKESEIE
ncbi:hypothetical protein RZO55_06235 [Clostridium boliviensis]|uniref:DUF3221 domain-containing protein n=1 Tax=Clostridium boliviensis TaxID=318465 RepID=A0ABU4GHS9_9CLOT|nr:hypothetical protein [Clostridium boliviensis]MDW2797174.1 hypothetical protein [Clostridium boliviensis]